VLEVDCIRATDGERFVQLLCDAISPLFTSAAAVVLIQSGLHSQPVSFCLQLRGRCRLRLLRGTKSLPQVWLRQEQLWQAFVLLQLPQLLAESLGKRLVLILQSFPTSAPGTAMGCGKPPQARLSTNSGELRPNSNDC